jgi:hypothetical protein
VPPSGPNFNTLFGVAAVPGKAWAVGVALNGSVGEGAGGQVFVAIIEAGRLDFVTDSFGTQGATAYSALAWEFAPREKHHGSFGIIVLRF